MQKKIYIAASLCVLALLTMGQAQCPQLPKPPFALNGTFTGTWQGVTDDQIQEIQACPLTLTLEQDTSLPWPNDHRVTGTAVIEYSCLTLPEWVQETPPPSVVQVGGLLGDDGKLTLLSGGCGTGMCVVLTLAGDCVDADADGLADAYSGTWAYAILLAGVQPFGVTGTFEVAREVE